MNSKGLKCECGKNCKCGKNCTCKGCTKHKNDNKHLLIGRLKEMIKELIKQSLDEMTGTPAVAGYLTKNAFGHTADATAGLPGFEKVGNKHTGTLQEKSKNRIVPVGKEKSPDVVKGPKSRGVKKDDVYILRKRRAIAASKKDDKDVNHYDALIGLAKKHGVQ